MKFATILSKKFQISKTPPFLFPRQRRPYWTNRSRFYCINQLHLMQGVIPPSFIKICWAGNEKNEVEVFQTFTVSMATVAILKFVSWHCTPYHAGWHSCEVSLTWVHPPSRNVSDKGRVKNNNNNNNNNNKKRDKNNKSSKLTFGRLNNLWYNIWWDTIVHRNASNIDC